ncbi:ParB/RepB/Spo0J family partition protein [Desulfopila aestuarii]|uniref:Chromosome partitioning protein, ParB family n=1 Tax=Desulfopila aestuarii DSM 18488 TaxID=1121416 RepID=A0A1M7XW74_9BACT|nr:ParB/RepB/Spo0J family partition protein [Desulfopila aestuarii]SHO43000.1 chromosome partitioning protein, ParB family [Desulfopila aestuarii DSM 18488]
MAKTTGLGQGVGLLFGDDAEEKYFQCDIDKISPNKFQPRLHFNEVDLQELADSIKENGVIQPLIVTQSEGKGGYELIAGERRLRASKMAGLDKVPVVVMDVTGEDTLLELALIENVQRTDLNPIEEAEAYQKLIQRFGYTQEDTAKRVGKKRSTVSNMLRLLNLPDFVKQDVIDGILSEGHARALLRLSDDIVAMKEIRDLIVKKALSVRQTEKIVRKATAASPGATTPSATKEGGGLPSTYCKALVNQLTNRLSAKVLIHQNGNRGKLEIEYYSTDDLERLISVIMNEAEK